MLLLCSPHNPTGTVHTADELRAVAEIADRVGATVVVDEVHAPLVPDGARFVPWLSVAGTGLVVTSAAKAFNLAGLKAALVVAGGGSRSVLRRLPESVRYGASHLGVIGHAAAYRSDPGWLDDVNANIAANRALLASLLAARIPTIGFQVPQATYLAWLDLRAVDLGDDPAEPILKRGAVALTPGPPFGPGGAGHARLNLACSAAVMTEAVERMASVVGAG
jgi:cystathionine beta-lyase